MYPNPATRKTEDMLGGRSGEIRNRRRRKGSVSTTLVSQQDKPDKWSLSSPPSPPSCCSIEMPRVLYIDPHGFRGTYAVH